MSASITDANESIASNAKKGQIRFDAKMYRAALQFYGLPTDYKHTLTSWSFTDKETGEVKNTLVACDARTTSQQGKKVWVAVNQCFAGKGITQAGKPKKPTNSDIQWVRNVPMDFEWPKEPELALTVAKKLIATLAAMGYVQDDHPIEHSGAGPHIVIPVIPIETTPETAADWNIAVSRVVKKYIEPLYDRFVEAVGLSNHKANGEPPDMKLGSYDISRIFSVPGTWRPANSEKPDCDALKQGFLRRWLAPYTDGNYPTRQESATVTALIQAEYQTIQVERQAKQQAQASQRSTRNTKNGALTSPIDFFHRHGIAYTEKDAETYILSDGCPWAAYHSTNDGGRSTGAIIARAGKPWHYRCFHDHCGDRTWHEFRKLYEPKHKTHEERETSSDRGQQQQGPVVEGETAENDEGPATEPLQDDSFSLADFEQALLEEDQQKRVEGVYAALPHLARLEIAGYGPYELKIKKALGNGYKTFQQALKEEQRKVKEQQGAAQRQNAADTSGYTIIDGAMYCDNGPRGQFRLCNFTAEITADILTDDGLETKRVYEIETQLNGRTRTLELFAKDFTRMDWVDDKLGGSAVVEPGQSIKAHIVNAIKSHSSFVERTSFKHTGWRKLDGEMMYLHAGGFLSAPCQVCQVTEEKINNLTRLSLKNESASQAVLESFINDTVSGVSGVSGKNIRYSVGLEKELSHYQLTSRANNLPEAVRSSLKLLDLTDDIVTMPAYAALWRSLLPQKNMCVHIVSQTGWGKSELAALLQQHFGAEMDANTLPANWDSTANYLETQLFQTKDALLVVDEFKPKGNKAERDRYISKASTVIQAFGNGSGRGRMNSDLTQRVTRRPRGMMISTGEDLPQTQSTLARCVLVTLTEPLTKAQSEQSRKLTELQEAASSGAFVEAMSGYIRWLAPYVETLEKVWIDLARQERTSLQQEGFIDGHARSVSNSAQLMLAMKLFLFFAVQIGAITGEQAQVYIDRCKEALKAVAEDASDLNKNESPVETFKRCLRAALQSQRAHLDDCENERGHELYGWKKSVRVATNPTTGMEEEVLSWHGGGDRIGYVKGDYVYLIPGAAYKVAMDQATATGSHLPSSQRVLSKALYDAGVLLSNSLDAKTRKSYAARTRSITGKPDDFLHVAKSFLYDDTLCFLHDTDDTPDTDDDETASQASSESEKTVSGKEAVSGYSEDLHDTHDETTIKSHYADPFSPHTNVADDQEYQEEFRL